MSKETFNIPPGERKDVIADQDAAVQQTFKTPPGKRNKDEAIEKTFDTPLDEYQSFDVINDLFLPIKEEEEKYASPILARFRENEVDPFEYLGEPKVEGVGPVRKVQDIEEQNKYSAAVLDFVKDLPEAKRIANAYYKYVNAKHLMYQIQHTRLIIFYPMRPSLWSLCPRLGVIGPVAHLRLLRRV